MLDLLLPFILVTQPLHSNESTSLLELPPVVVIATRSQRPLADVVGSVSVIGSEEMADQLVRNPADLIRFQTDITIPRSGTRFGFGGYSIRGIGGNRVAVEIDGVPVPDQFDIGSFSNSQRDVVDLSLIRQVEILRGPASTLYGSDALGGVVSYSTVNADDLNGPVAVQASHHTADSASAASVMAGNSGGALDVVASATHRSGNQFDTAATSAQGDRNDYDSTSAFLKVSAQVAERQKLTVTADTFRRGSRSDVRSILGNGRFRSTTLLTGDDDQQRQRLSARWDLDAQWAWLDTASVIAFAQGSQTEQATIEERAGADIRRQRVFSFDQDVRGIRAHMSSGWDAGGVFHNLGYGVDIRRTETSELRDALETGLDGSNPSADILGEHFPVRDFPNSLTDEIGVYIHDEMSLSERWTAIAAVRFDDYRLKPETDPVYLEDHPSQAVVSLHEAEWSPKAGLLFHVTDNSTAYLQWARGFRAPPFEDANIGLDIPLFNIRALPNPELKSETSNGVEVGWRMDSGTTRWSAAAYYTRFQDFIETKARIGTDPVTGTLLFQSRNLDSAEIYGIQLEYEHAFGPSQLLGPWTGDTSVRLGAHINEGQNRMTGDGLNSLDPARLVASLRWDPTALPVSLELHATATGAKQDASGPDLFIPGGHTVFDATARWRISENAELRLGAFNLGDKTYWRWSDVAGLDPDDPLVDQLAAPGRNAALSFSYHW